MRKLLVVAVLMWCVLAPIMGQETPIVIGGNSSSLDPAISGDGRYIAFASDASNLVEGDTNDHTDVFVHDRETGATTRVSLASNGTQASDYSRSPDISADGRYIAFESNASDLVEDDTNGRIDVFVHDRETGEMVRVSVNSEGVEGDLDSLEPSISGDGRKVSFWSNATNLVSDDPNYGQDVFVHDLETGETVQISVELEGMNSDGLSYQNRISADGRFVAFRSNLSYLVEDDTNGMEDLFVYDLDTNETTRVTVASDGSESKGYTFEWFSISADGQFVAFQSDATNLSDEDNDIRNDVFVHDRETGETTLISADAACDIDFCFGSSEPSISGDGRYVTFSSDVTGFIPDDTNASKDVFVYDRETGETVRASVTSEGKAFEVLSIEPAISGDGRYVAFESSAPFALTDINFSPDIYVFDRETEQTTLVSVGNPR